jgi:hypothetical protein
MARNRLHNDSGKVRNVRPADGVPEEWFYMGRRIVRGGKIAYGWLTADGEEVLFDKVKATVIGGAYEIEVIYGDDARSVYRNTVKYAGRMHSDKKKVQQWALEDKAAYTEQQRRGIEKKKAKEEKPLANMTLKEVGLMCRRAPSQRSAIIATVISEILYAQWDL